MTNEKQPPKGVKLGLGTRTQGRVTDNPPENVSRTVGRQEPPYEVTGLDALSPLLEHVEFPATREDIVARIGDMKVPIDSERAEPVSRIMERVTPNEFRSSGEVEAAVNVRWDEIAEKRGRGDRKPKGDNLTERPRND